MDDTNSEKVTAIILRYGTLIHYMFCTMTLYQRADFGYWVRNKGLWEGRDWTNPGGSYWLQNADGDVGLHNAILVVLEFKENVLYQCTDFET